MTYAPTARYATFADIPKTTPSNTKPSLVAFNASGLIDTRKLSAGDIRKRREAAPGETLNPFVTDDATINALIAEIAAVKIAANEHDAVKTHAATAGYRALSNANKYLTLNGDRRLLIERRRGPASVAVKRKGFEELLTKHPHAFKYETTIEPEPDAMPEFHKYGKATAWNELSTVHLKYTDDSAEIDKVVGLIKNGQRPALAQLDGWLTRHATHRAELAAIEAGLIVNLLSEVAALDGLAGLDTLRLAFYDPARVHEFSSSARIDIRVPKARTRFEGAKLLKDDPDTHGELFEWKPAPPSQRMDTFAFKIIKVDPNAAEGD